MRYYNKMLSAKFSFRCAVCNNKNDWYIQPKEEKTKSGDYYNSMTEFEITCKNCGQRYILILNIKKKRDK